MTLARLLSKYKYSYGKACVSPNTNSLTIVCNFLKGTEYTWKETLRNCIPVIFSEYKELIFKEQSFKVYENNIFFTFILKK